LILDDVYGNIFTNTLFTKASDFYMVYVVMINLCPKLVNFTRQKYKKKGLQ